MLCYLIGISPFYQLLSEQQMKKLFFLLGLYYSCRTSGSTNLGNYKLEGSD